MYGQSVTAGGSDRLRTALQRWSGYAELGRMWTPSTSTTASRCTGRERPSVPGVARLRAHPRARLQLLPEPLVKGDQKFVFDGVEGPEAYERQVPPFDAPEATTTTTSSTTTTTTLPPETRPPDTPGPPRPASSAADRGTHHHTDHGRQGRGRRRALPPHPDAALINRVSRSR